MTAPEATHYLSLCNDFDGWDYAECACGWASPPCPDVETAADFYGDHRAGMATNLPTEVPDA